MTVEASDQRSTPCKRNTTLTLTVSRGSPPSFLNTPYRTLVDEKAQPGQSIYMVTARDDDLQVSYLDLNILK